MARDYSTEDEVPELHPLRGGDTGGRDREITLGVGMVLGIFFAITLICAVFFGFGYSLGRRSSQSTAPAGTNATASTNFNTFKPSPNSPALQPVPDSASASSGPTVSLPAGAASTLAGNSTAAPGDNTSASVTTATVPLNDSSAAAAATQPVPYKPAFPGPSSASTPVLPTSPAIVQVAAVSHQEDADVLLSALRKRGYNVTARQEPQDNLIHIQVGPFANRRDAEAMRQKLLADGFNAIVK